jgi:hypothetical protein
MKANNVLARFQMMKTALGLAVVFSFVGRAHVASKGMLLAR